MKKNYIIPFITIEDIEGDCVMQQISKVGTGVIGEGDNVTNSGQLGNGQLTGGDGSGGEKPEGMDAKASFWDDMFEEGE